MTDGEIKDLANEAGADSAGLNVESASVLAMFKRFAISIESRAWTDTKARWYQAGVEAEREACAAIVDAEMEENAWESNASVVLNNVAAEIRARGE